MKLVAAGFGADTDHAAQEVAELGARVVRYDVELLDCIDVRRIRDVIVHELVIIDTVEQIIIGLLAIAVDVGPARIECGKSGVKSSWASGHSAGREECELVIVTRLQRQVRDRVSVHYRAHLRGIRLQKGSSSR